MTPRGIRNNNPGNLRSVAGVTWLGQTGQDDAGFCVFDTPEHGIRAAAKQLIAYQDRHSLNTVRGIINRWAPPVENDTSAYVNAVGDAMGATDFALDLHDPRTLAMLVTAIIRHENGQQPYAEALIAAGVADALGLAIPVYTPPHAAPAADAAPLPESRPMGLLAALLPSVLSLFAPRAQATLQKVTGQPPDVVQPFLTDLFAKIGTVTGQAEPIAAVAALQNAPPEQVKAVEDHALDYLDKIAPMFDKLVELDKARWAAATTERDAASARAARDKWDMTRYLVLFAGTTSTVIAGALLGAIIYQAISGDRAIDSALLALAGPLLAICLGVWREIFAYRFGGTQDSVAQDVGATVISRARQR